MKYAPLDLPPSYPISATYMNTEPDQTAPWVMPGNYMVRLTVDGKVFEQPFTVKMDPRVKTSFVSLLQQHDLSVKCYNSRKECMEILQEIKSARALLKNQPAKKELDKKLSLLENSPLASDETSFGRLNNAFASIFNILQETDMPATTQTIRAFGETQSKFKNLALKWQELKKGLPPKNN
jgi:hypothetical protein